MRKMTMIRNNNRTLPRNGKKPSVSKYAMVLVKTALLLGIAAPHMNLDAAENKCAGKKKKLIHAGWSDPDTATVRRHISLLESAAPFYSGVRIFMKGTDESGKTVTHRMMFGKRKFKYDYFKQAVEDLKNTKFRRFTDNFLATGVQPGNISWFSDSDWDAVCANFAIFARIAKETGMAGIIFDSEEYSNKLWRFKSVSGRSRDECIAMARKRGRQFAKAVFGEFPSCKLFCFFWCSLNGKYVHYPENAQLSAHFINGVYDVLPPEAVIYDGMENYGYRVRERCDIYRMGKIFYQDFPLLLAPENRAKYYAQTKLAGAIYLDAYFSLPKESSYAYWLTDRKEKLGVTELFRRNLQLTLEISDEYAWTWGERGAWWLLPDSREKRVSWDQHAPGAMQAAADAFDPVAVAARRVRERKCPNLLKNPEFREKNRNGAPAGWSCVQNKKISSGTFRMDFGKGLCFDGILEGSAIQSIPVSGSKEYLIAAEGEIEQSAASPGAQLAIGVEYRNAKKLLTGFCEGKMTVFGLPDKSGTRRAAMVVEVPPDVETLIVKIQALNLEKGGRGNVFRAAVYEC